MARPWGVVRRMDAKRPIDAAGAAGLIVFSTTLALNQVVVKLTNDGFAPVFQAGLRSVLALGIIGGWILWQRLSLDLTRSQVQWGVISGVLFAAEFVFLFNALDLTSVARASIIFYSMPVWLGIAAHILLPGERLSAGKIAGMALAFGGVVLALAERGGDASLLGDALALLASFGWAAIALTVRATPLASVRPEIQLGFQLAVSGPVLLVLAPAFGPLLRDLQPLHLWGLAFQVICVASLGFLFWFHLMKIYRASGVASFSFLSPVLAVIFGWLILGEEIGVQVWGALALVAVGLILINRK